MAENLTVKEARELITSGEVFDMVWTTANDKQNTGGKRITAKNLVICGTSYSDKPNGTFTVRSIGTSLSHPTAVHWDLVEFVNGIEVI